MRVPAPERGFLLIVAVIVIAVGGAMAVVILTLMGGSSGAGINHLQSTQALFIAESGLEKAIRQRSLSNTYVGEGPTSMGQGNYTISVFDTDFGGAPLPSGQRRLRSVGRMDAGTRTVEAIVRTGGAMMVYAKETPAGSVGIPFFRQWNNDTNAWGPENQANSVGTNIYFMVLKFARTRNEAMLGTMNANGQIHVQIWNGTSWGAVRLLATVGAANAAYRGIDIAYEGQDDRAMVIYNNANNRNPGFQIWDGSTWTTGDINFGGNYSNNNSAPVWIDITSDPRAGSNNLALITVDALRGVYGTVWDGTQWLRISGSGALWGSIANLSRKAMDVAYEQISGRVMFIYGTTTSGTNQQQFRIWNDVTLAGPTNQTITSMSNTANWIRLEPQPGTNNFMYAVQDNGRDLHTLFWNGAAFGAQVTHDTSTEAAASRNFDIVFETHPNTVGDAWLVWGTATGSDQVRRRRWNGATASWDALLPKIGDDTAFIRLTAHHASGAVFAGIYQSSASAGSARDILEINMTGGSGTWTNAVQIWDGGAAADPVRHRIDIAVERRTPAITRREVFP